MADWHFRFSKQLLRLGGLFLHFLCKGHNYRIIYVLPIPLGLCDLADLKDDGFIPGF